VSSSATLFDSHTGDESLAKLRDLVSRELGEEVRPGVIWLADQIRAKYGDGVCGVLFYGSCLRKESNEGVLDFWIIVDDYATAYSDAGLTGRVHALLNRIAPPNVFYFESAFEGETLRTKYGVIDRRDFVRNTSLAARHPYVWARFAQPARLLAIRDDAARETLVAAVSESIVTMVGRLVCFLPIRAGQVRFRVAAFWQLAFGLTYDSERRPESEDSIRGLYLADEDRYDEVATLAVNVLIDRGQFDSAVAHPRAIDIGLSARKRALQRFRWRMMRPYARMLGLVRLIKTAWTFGDWVPYALWKLERHTGHPLEVSERQKRHPFIFGWPIILPLLFKRNLR
jgi:predicted nucleotidyltransferase